MYEQLLATVLICTEIVLRFHIVPEDNIICKIMLL